MDYVAAILAAEVRVNCSSLLLREKFSTFEMACDDDDADLCLRFSTKNELAEVLTKLQSFAVPFGNEPAGWSPAAVFEQLRDEGFVDGKIKTVVWRGRGDPVYDEV